MGVVTEHRKTIDGVPYVATTYPAMYAIQMMGRLRRVAPDEKIEKIIEFLIHKDDGGLSEKQVEALFGEPAVLMSLLMGASKEWADKADWALPRDLLKHTETDQLQLGDAVGKGSVFDFFDEHFAGRLGHLGKVVLWATKVGFGKP